MESEEKQTEISSVGEMRKRPETMADGKRYIIFYTFGGSGDDESKKNEVVKEDV